MNCLLMKLYAYSLGDIFDKRTVLRCVVRYRPVYMLIKRPSNMLTSIVVLECSSKKALKRDLTKRLYNIQNVEVILASIRNFERWKSPIIYNTTSMSQILYFTNNFSKLKYDYHWKSMSFSWSAFKFFIIYKYGATE